MCFQDPQKHNHYNPMFLHKEGDLIAFFAQNSFLDARTSTVTFSRDVFCGLFDCRWMMSTCYRVIIAALTFLFPPSTTLLLNLQTSAHTTVCSESESLVQFFAMDEQPDCDWSLSPTIANAQPFLSGNSIRRNFSTKV